MTWSPEASSLKQVTPREDKNGVWVGDAFGCASLPLATWSWQDQYLVNGSELGPSDSRMNGPFH
jgi:hypothetical protein